MRSALQLFDDISVHSTVDTIIKDVCKELKAIETRVVSAYPQLEDVS